MKSKKQNNRYIIQESEREAPVKIYAKKTDATLEKLKRQSEALRRTVKQIYDTDYDLYRILDREIFCTSGLDLEDGSNWRLDLLSDEIKYLQSRLNEQDDDLEAFQFQKNTAITLYDLGFRKRYGTSDWMEKIIEDSDEKEVVEEIQYKDPANLVRRLRTVYWEKTDYGKTSKDIRYKKLQIGKKLMMAIQNTVKVQAP